MGFPARRETPLPRGSGNIATRWERTAETAGSGWLHNQRPAIFQARTPSPQRRALTVHSWRGTVPFASAPPVHPESTLPSTGTVRAMVDNLEAEGFDNPFARMVLEDGHCFLCGHPLGADATREHLFPAWILDRHDLWDRQLTLLNGTAIPYRQLTVPCCATCNNEDLAAVERRVAQAFAGGYEAVLALDKLTLFNWAGKLFFGVLFKELSLLLDRRNPQRGTIVSRAFLSELDALHGLLQSVNRPVEFVGDPPFSILVANLHVLPEPEAFDFHDRIFQMTLSVRSNDVGIIVAFDDGGLNERTYGRYLAAVAGRKLHPEQFDELFAKVSYNRKRMRRAPKYMFVVPDDRQKPFQFITLPLLGMSRAPLLEDWNQEEYATFLAVGWEKWGYRTEALYEPPDKVRSLMSDETGELLLLDANLNRIPRS
jgi:hypothetical protein